MTLTGMNWLKKQLRKIQETSSSFKEQISIIKNIERDVVNEFHPWTPLKLIFLNFTLDVCSIVANKRYSKKNYIDLFAGSGINRIGEKKDSFIGSPFIALFNHSNKFTRFIFCESNSTFYNALNKRIVALNFNNTILYPQDCCSQMDNILEGINGETNTYNFFFIDPYNTEFSWASMKKILNIRSDILLTFMTRTIWRDCCTEKATGHGHLVLNRFFGDESWKKAKNENDLIEIYKKNILNERGDAVTLDTKINSSKGGFNYSLIFVTHRTSGGNPWLNPIKDAKNEIEKHTDISIKSLLEIITKRQMTFDDLKG